MVFLIDDEDDGEDDDLCVHIVYVCLAHVIYMPVAIILADIYLRVWAGRGSNPPGGLLLGWLQTLIRVGYSCPPAFYFLSH